MQDQTFESLESRRLLAATLQSARLDAATGKVILVGSAAADNIELALYRSKTKNQARVIDGGEVVLTFDLDVAKLVSFAGYDGADHLSMGRVPLRLYAEGGNGADAISGGRFAYADTLYGDSANDYLFGGAGDDLIDGGGGYDQLLGGDGSDNIKVLSDSDGDDTVLGGAGNNDTVDTTNYNRGITLRVGDESPGPLAVDDRVWGGVEVVLGTGFDDTITRTTSKPLTIYLGLGNDRYVGGSGNETVYGQGGNDSLFGNGGDDELVDDDGNNAFDGGTGTDAAVYSSAGTNTFVAIETRNDILDTGSNE